MTTISSYTPTYTLGCRLNWAFTDAQAKKIREYLLRGGFMICDSFFGTQEWEGFLRGIRQIFPDREIVDLPADDPIFATMFAIKERYQVANFRSMLRNGHTYRADGKDPQWRGIRDDHGRVVVAINFNNDFGDSWQLADDPRYPEKYSYLGIRQGLNYVLYAMTH